MRLCLDADRRLVVAVRRKRKEGCGGRRGIGGSRSLRGTLRAPRSARVWVREKNNMMKNRKNYCSDGRFFLFFEILY